MVYRIIYQQRTQTTTTGRCHACPHVQAGGAGCNVRERRANVWEGPVRPVGARPGTPVSYSGAVVICTGARVTSCPGRMNTSWQSDRRWLAEDVRSVPEPC